MDIAVVISFEALWILTILARYQYPVILRNCCRCVFLRKLPPNPEITLPLIPSSNTLVDSNTKVAGLRQLFV